MRRVILSGAPGSGKTALLRLLEITGYRVIEEAATDIIALAQARGEPEPWKQPGFTDAIAALQRQRQMQTPAADDIVLFDRSPICTYALALFLEQTPSQALKDELARIEREQIYDRRVLFLETLGFITATAARRIDLPGALRFETLHIETYRQFGYELVTIPKRPIEQRLACAVAALTA